MAEIYPFRGISFNRARVGSFDDVVTQPYDKITPRMQAEYYEKSPYNIVRIILPRTDEADPESRYPGAAGTFSQWLAQGILERSDQACLYPYFQEYKVPGTGRVRTRKGFVGLGRLSDFSEGLIRPHEHTHSGPKIDRLKLTRATGSHFGQLFMLYPDPDLAVNGLLDEAVAGKEPMIQVSDEDGVKHTMWKLDRSESIAAVQEKMRPVTLYIADGHHRYETALTYYRERAGDGVKPVGHEALDRAMMTFVSLHDQGLSVLPTHRVLFALRDFSLAGLLEKLSDDFEVKQAGPANKNSLLENLHGMAAHQNNFLLAVKKEQALVALRLKRRPEALVPGGGSEVWKSLDVTVLHKLILERHLGIDAGALERQENVSYLRDPSEALDMVLDSESKYQAAFFLNPTRVDQVKAVADRGECMPQKSTDFYPKMLTGLVINRINQS